MKTLLTILSSLLVALVLMSSISYSVSFHLCSGEIQNVALSSKAQACTEHDSGCDRDENKDHGSLNHEGCCEDSNLVVDTDKYLSKITEEITVGGYQDISIPAIDLVRENSHFPEAAHTHGVIYKPPLIERDITILVQTFLI